MNEFLDVVWSLRWQLLALYVPALTYLAWERRRA